MTFEGGCYCGQVRYVAEGQPQLKAQRRCRECQYISGGAPNMFMLMPPDGFRYVSGTPKTFTRGDLDQPVTREFCANCGTHLTARRPDLPLVIRPAAVPYDSRIRFGHGPTIESYIKIRRALAVVRFGPNGGECR
jgi:hypothetical protein